jgi:hypothetical protein
MVGVVIGGFGPLVAAWIITSIEGTTRSWARQIVAWRAPLVFYLYALGLPALLWAVMNLALTALGEPVRMSLLDERAPAYLGSLVSCRCSVVGSRSPGGASSRSPACRNATPRSWPR